MRDWAEDLHPAVKQGNDALLTTRCGAVTSHSPISFLTFIRKGIWLVLESVEKKMNESDSELKSEFAVQDYN